MPLSLPNPSRGDSGGNANEKEEVYLALGPGDEWIGGDTGADECDCPPDVESADGASTGIKTTKSKNKKSTKKVKASRVSELLMRVKHRGRPESKPVVVAVQANDHTAVVRFLVSGKVFGFPKTNGSFCWNWYRFVCNEHPLLTIWMQHPWHPFTKRRRVVVLYNIICMAFFVTVVLMSETYFPELRRCEDGCESTYTTDDDGGELMCGNGSGGNTNTPAKEYDDSCYFYAPYLVSFVASCIIIPFGTFLRIMATCSCLAGNDWEDRYCLKSVKRWAQKFGGNMLFYATCVTTLLFLYGMYLAETEGEAMTVLFAFIYTEGFQMVDWFVFAFIYFAVMFLADREWFLLNYNDEEAERKADEDKKTEEHRRMSTYLETIDEEGGGYV